MMPHLTLCQGCGKLVPLAQEVCVLCGTLLGEKVQPVVVVTPKLAIREMEPLAA